MDELKRDLAATREGLGEVREELSKRPTKRQVVIAAALVVIAVAIGTFFAVRAALESGDAKDAAVASQANGEQVAQGFIIQGCRSEIRSSTLELSAQRLSAAEQARASAIQKRDNLTIEALQALALKDEEGVRRVALQAPAARNLVTWTDAIVQQRVDEADQAQKDYDAAIDRSIKDPEGFVKECKSRGD